jgi:hypothetical protein
VRARIFSALVPGQIVLSHKRDALAFESGDAVRLERASGLPAVLTVTVRGVDRDEGLVVLHEAVRAEPGDWLTRGGE